MMITIIVCGCLVFGPNSLQNSSLAPQVCALWFSSRWCISRQPDKDDLDPAKAASAVVRPEPTHVELLGVDPLVRAGEGGGQGGQAEQRGEGEEEHGELREAGHWSLTGQGFVQYTLYTVLSSVYFETSLIYH